MINLTLRKKVDRAMNIFINIVSVGVFTTALYILHRIEKGKSKKVSKKFVAYITNTNGVGKYYFKAMIIGVYILLIITLYKVIIDILKLQ